MRYIKLYENFDSRDEEIKQICKKHRINDYVINEDGSVDVIGDLNLSNSRLTEIPLKFRIVSGSFNISNNNLMSLKNSPIRVGRDFNADSNNLESLEFSPQEVNGSYSVSHNKLKTLKGTPPIVKDFICSMNKLTNLEYLPIINGRFYCGFNKLETLEGSPEILNGDFFFGGNLIKNLKGSPRTIYGDFLGFNTKSLVSLEFGPEHISGAYRLGDCSIDSAEFITKGLNKVELGDNNIYDLKFLEDCVELVIHNNPIYEIYKIINNTEHIELFNEYDIITEDKKIILFKLNEFFLDIGKEEVKSIRGYDII